MKWIDSYAHVKTFSPVRAEVTTSPLLDLALDATMRALHQPSVRKLYGRYMDLLNQRDNLGMSSRLTAVSKAVSRISLATNLPFSGAMDELDLLESMGKNSIDHCILVNLEPYGSADEILDIARREPSAFTAVVHLKKAAPSSFLKRAESAVEKGARGLAIHPILEGLSPTSDHYQECARFGAEKGVPLVCRTGVTFYSEGYDAKAGEIENYETLVRGHPRTVFVMTHSNLAEYEKAIGFARRHENVFLDTAWQTAGSMRKILKAVGASRVLFASDWPVLGDQQRVQKRILSRLKLSAKDLEKVAGGNARDLYRIN